MGVAKAGSEGLSELLWGSCQTLSVPAPFLVHTPHLWGLLSPKCLPQLNFLSLSHPYQSVLSYGVRAAPDFFVHPR